MSAALEPKVDVSAEVLRNVRIAPNAHALDLRCPDLAPRLGPGQFVQVRVSPGHDPFLRRPFSIADHVREDGEPTGIRILYVVVGRGTAIMAGWTPGERADVLGPLGRPFDLDRVPDHAVLVAGGIGMAPFPLLARALRERGCREIEMLFGARSADGIYYREELEALGVAVRPATEDGSLGSRGRVTDLLRERLSAWDPAGTVIYACGPNPMFRAMGPILEEAPIPCQMALEQEMACGFGVCNGCVVRVRGPEGPVWEKVCTDGPVFDARRLVLEEL
jgi:dihydroorotate dehydrogenase electron transfer subunit